LNAHPELDQFNWRKFCDRVTESILVNAELHRAIVDHELASVRLENFDPLAEPVTCIDQLVHGLTISLSVTNYN